MKPFANRLLVGLLTTGLLLAALVMPLLVTQPVQAQSSAWTATYWNNRDLSGNPVLQRTELTVTQDWGTGSPDEVVNRDNFSARWERTVDVAAGTYRFTITADDGVRLYVDGVNVIDDFSEGGAGALSADVFLSQGQHTIRVDYFEALGLASIDYSRTLLFADAPAATATPVRVDNSPGVDFWRGEYFNNRNLAGNPALIRDDNNIDFTFGLGSPDPVIDSDNFSARWTRTLNLAPGRYRFAMTVDDGGRLYVNDRLVLDEFRDQPRTTFTTEVDIPGGSTTVRMEYYEATAGATARLSYANITSAPAPTPTTPPVSQSGSWRGAYYNNVDFAGNPALVRDDANINFDWGFGSPDPAVNNDRFSARWSRTFDLPADRYVITAVMDDGVRVRANGNTLIDRFSVSAAQSNSAILEWGGGSVNFEVDYFENFGRASASFEIAPTSPGPGPGQPAPTATPAPDDDDDDARYQAVMTEAFFLNVRRGPSIRFDVVDVIGRGVEVEVIGRNASSTWIEIVLPDGRTGWANQRFFDRDFFLRELPVTYGSTSAAQADTYSGISAVDTAIQTILSGDARAVQQLVRFSDIACTTRSGLGGPPSCEDGQADGTVVSVLPIMVQNGTYLPEEDIGDFDLNADNLYAVYRVPDDAVRSDYMPPGEHGLLFLNGDDFPATFTVFVTDGAIVRVSYNMDNDPAQTLTRVDGEIIYRSPAAA